MGIRSLINKVDEAKSNESLQGYEGKGTAIYFDGFSRGILSGELKFKHRVRRPPTDPVNALLSLGYTLLFNTVLAGLGFKVFINDFMVEENYLIECTKNRPFDNFPQTVKLF